MEPDDNKLNIDAVSTRPLPPGKLYHVFFSHSSEDTGWVRGIVDKLESEEYGYKCCFADRDFGIGIPVLQNITTCIHTSRRTVIVMSPEFIDSAWCTYETRITMELDIDTRRRLLIPVMLRECRVPKFIGRLSFINAQNEHFWDRLLEAIDANDLENNLRDGAGVNSSFLTSTLLDYNPNYYTGQHLTDLVINEPCRTSTLDGDFIPEELVSRGLEVAQEEYDLVLKFLRKDYYLRWHGMFIFLFWIIILSFITAIIMFFLFIFETEVGNRWADAFCALSSFFFLSALLATPGICARAVSIRRSTIREVNKILQSRSVMAGLCDNGQYAWTCRKNIKIKFFFYRWTSCKIHLQKILFSMEESDDDNLLDVVINEQQNECNEIDLASTTGNCSVDLDINSDALRPLLAINNNGETESFINADNREIGSSLAITGGSIGPFQNLGGAEAEPFINSTEVSDNSAITVTVDCSRSRASESIVTTIPEGADSSQEFGTETDEHQRLLQDHQLDIGNTTSMEEALELLLYFSMEYGNILAARKLNKPDTQRHTMQGECLCQFAESLLKDTTGKSSRFKRVFGGLSRNPWSRCFRY